MAVMPLGVAGMGAAITEAGGVVASLVVRLGLRSFVAVDLSCPCYFPVPRGMILVVSMIHCPCDACRSSMRMVSILQGSIEANFPSRVLI